MSSKKILPPDDTVRPSLVNHGEADEAVLVYFKSLITTGPMFYAAPEDVEQMLKGQAIEDQKNLNENTIPVECNPGKRRL